MTDMASPTLSYILFDIGGTLIDCDPRYLYRRLFDTDCEVAFFLREVCSPEWNRSQDAGFSTAAAVAHRCTLFPAYAPYITLYYDRFDEMIAGPIKGMEVLVTALLTRKVPLYALSNWPRETFPIALSRFPLLRCFSGILLS